MPCCYSLKESWSGKKLYYTCKVEEQIVEQNLYDYEAESGFVLKFKEEGKMLIAFIIWSVVAVLFLGIGIVGRKSKEAVGFFTFVKPPKVTDLNKYNHSVSILWIIVAVIFEIIGVPLLFLEQNSPMFIFVIVGVAALSIGMMIAYLKIEEKYKA